MKNKILISILVLLVVLVFTSERRTNKLKELGYNFLTKINILKTCYKANENFIEIFTQEGFDYTIIDDKITQESLTKISSLQHIEGETRIPKITHHTYFTSLENPKILTDFYLEKMKANFNKLNATDTGWQHYIWTNNPELFPSEIKQILGVQIHSIQELQYHILYPALVESVEKGSTLKAHFSEASDILRFVAVQKFGGIYNDMDYEIYNAASLYNLMKQFDFIGGRELTKDLSYYGSAFFAAKANHPVLNEVIAKRMRNLKVRICPDYIKHPCNLYDGIYFNAPPLITLAYFAKNNINGNNDVILPAWMLFNVDFAHSKNLGCEYSKLTKVEFEQNNANLTKLLSDFANKTNKKYDIIGADMFCGGWSDSKVGKNYYWIWND